MTTENRSLPQDVSRISKLKLLALVLMEREWEYPRDNWQACRKINMKLFDLLSEIHGRELTLDEITQMRLAIVQSKYARHVAQFGGREQKKNEFLSFKFLIPRKYREEILGDLHEDISEMRRNGFGTWKIRAVVYYQLAWAIVKLWPATLRAAVFAWLGAKVQQWLS